MTAATGDLLLAFYGDDFTGSTDALEVMAFAGVEAVLFVAPPTPAQLARFAGRQAIGIAGTARSRPPAWMEAHLPAVFDWLFSLGAPITQYKVCSTFDSSPEVGSIGRAIDIALPRSPSTWTPTLVAAPALGRYQAFGNLFAGASMGGRTTVERLDRHPTMARHPITPMDESDLRRHLARQTDRRLALMDLAELADPEAAAILRRKIAAGAEVVLFDAVDEAGLLRAGRAIWEARGEGVFSASSSGLDYALVGHLRAAGLIGDAPPPPAQRPVGQTLVVSGSCAPATGRQIEHALASGFAGVKLDVRGLTLDAPPEQAAAPLIESGRKALRAGRDLAIYSAAGPDDPDLLKLDPALQARVGELLGLTLRQLLDESPVERVLVAGGDTSGRVAAALDILALTALAPCAPGSPLCRVHSENPRLDGLEIVFKGGQAGGTDFFTWVKAGAPRAGG